MYTNFEQMPSIKLCCCGGKACPIIKFDGKNVIIIDDVGNRSWITVEQALMLSDTVKQLIEKSKD
jgi:hypothetical protein